MRKRIYRGWTADVYSPTTSQCFKNGRSEAARMLEEMMHDDSDERETDEEYQMLCNQFNPQIASRRSAMNCNVPEEVWLSELMEAANG